MLGRTHMAIGVTAAAALSPLVLHSHWMTMRQLALGNLTAAPHTVVAEASLVAGALAGSIVVDLDEANSLMAHRVERIGQAVIFASLVALLFVMHLQTSVAAWLMVVFITALSGVRSNVARRIGLGVLGAGILAAAAHGDVPILSGVLLAGWMAGAMFTPHRTFTHSALGFILFACGAVMALGKLHLGIVADGLVIGYLLHMAADAISGGIPLLWPLPKRQGISLVRTGGAWDHLIGGLATLAFIGFALL